jgi:phosphopantetheinyl transferase (holo-ACP synthase)
LPTVGNDVVDLKEPENLGKCGNERFLDRVLTVAERTLVVDAKESDALLWSFWAAKEAAYKAVSRGDPSVCSIPRRYHVFLDSGNSGATGADSMGPEGRLAGRVVTPVGEFALQIILTEDYVHAVVTESAAGFAGITHRVDRADAKDGGDASQFVRRQLLGEIARRLDCPLEDLAVRKGQSGSGPPEVYFRDQPLAVELSLSHDGRFAAFALRLPRRNPAG